MEHTKTAAMFFVNGFEETEAIVPADILRRGGVCLDTVSLTGVKEVKGSHEITILADLLFPEITDKAYDMLILPGGPGTKSYALHDGFMEYLKKAHANGVHISAICAAPTILASLGITDGKKAVCFPGMEGQMGKAVMTNAPCVTDGAVTTGQAAGAAFAFGFELLCVLCGKSVQEDIKTKMVCK